MRDESDVVLELTLHFQQSGKSEAQARALAIEHARQIRLPKPPSPPDPIGGPSTTFGLLASIAQDVRYGLRSLRRTPGFAVASILTLALGIGATTAMYSVVDAVLVRSLPFPDADRLVRIHHTVATLPGGKGGLAAADFLMLRAENRSFTSLATYQMEEFTYVGPERAERVFGTFVSGEFFSTVGLTPLLGRVFARADDDIAAARVAVIGHDFWRQRLNGDPKVIGRAINISGQSVTIVGVMRPGVWFPRSDRAELWLNQRFQPTQRCECAFGNRAIARLRPGVSPQQVKADLDRVATLVRAKYHSPAGSTFVTESMQRAMVGDLRKVLLMLMGAVGLVLLIACVNVTNLSLARATAREQELAVRIALGASRGRITRQLVAESSIVALVGAVIGVVVAKWGVQALIALAPPANLILRDAGSQVNGRVLGITIVATMLCAIVVGALPALLAVRDTSGDTLREGSRGGSDGRRRRMVRNALVIAEFAFSVVLVAGAGLFLRTLAKLQQVDIGVRAEHVLTASIALPGVRYSDTAMMNGFQRRLLETVRVLPGVASVAISDALPPAGLGNANNFWIEGTPPPDKNGWEPIAQQLNVSNDYFTTFGIPVLSGRAFDSRETMTTPSSILINQTFAAKMFPGQNPLGRRMYLGGDRQTAYTIVGVVGNVKYEGLGTEDRTTMYVSFTQEPQFTFSIAARTMGEPAALGSMLRNAVRTIDPALALAHVQTLDELVSGSTATNRFRALLLGLLAGIALLLAAVGIYGVMSYVVGRRTREMGLRMALGAQAGDVRGLVIREGLVLAGAGIVLGLVLAASLAKLVSSLLFGVAPHDPATFGGVAGLLALVAAAACYVPARRATRVDPMVALRSD